MPLNDEKTQYAEKWIILACIFRTFPPGVSNEMDTLAAVSRSTKPDGLARVAFSPKS